MSIMTNDIRYGKEVTPENFIKYWARMYGPLVHMRDAPFNAPLQLREYNTYAPAQVKKSKGKLEHYKNMTLEEAEAIVEKQYQEAIEYQKESFEEVQQLKEKYEALLSQVEGWNPPTDRHKEIKESAINDLKHALATDCVVLLPVRTKIEKEDPQEYIDSWVRTLENQIERYEEKIEEDKKYVDECNQWITDLLESLEKTYED